MLPLVKKEEGQRTLVEIIEDARIHRIDPNIGLFLSLKKSEEEEDEQTDAETQLEEEDNE
jgi:hypothetical protein